MWYVIQTLWGEEHKVAQILKSDLLSDTERAFVPTYEKKIKKQGQTMSAVRKLFPCYVFVETEEAVALPEKLRSLRETKGYYKLLKLLKTGESIIPLSGEEEERLRQLMGDSHHVAMSKGIIENEQVVFTEGPLMNSTGRVKKVLRHRKLAVIEYELFGRTVEMTVGLEIVEKVP